MLGLIVHLGVKFNIHLRKSTLFILHFSNSKTPDDYLIKYLMITYSLSTAVFICASIYC